MVVTYNRERLSYVDFEQQNPTVNHDFGFCLYQDEKRGKTHLHKAVKYIYLIDEIPMFLFHFDLYHETYVYTKLLNTSI
jgi:hypothetical protein